MHPPARPPTQPLVHGAVVLQAQRVGQHLLPLGVVAVLGGLPDALSQRLKVGEVAVLHHPSLQHQQQQQTRGVSEGWQRQRQRACECVFVVGGGGGGVCPWAPVFAPPPARTHACTSQRTRLDVVCQQCRHGGVAASVVHVKLAAAWEGGRGGEAHPQRHNPSVTTPVAQHKRSIDRVHTQRARAAPQRLPRATW